MFLSVDSLAVEIVTAKSSEMNVLIPTGDDFVSFELFIYFKLLLIAFLWIEPKAMWLWLIHDIGLA